MNIQLILFRHGKAESLKSGGRDEDRALTESGKADLRKTISGLRELIAPNQEVHLWASPKLRATQTAYILSEGLDLHEIQCFDFISRGDYFDLTSELATLKSPCTVIIVGHEPYLGEWSKSLCGRLIPLAKSSAVSFSLNASYPQTGDIEWLLQLNNPGPDRKKSLMNEYRKVLMFYLSEISKTKIAFLKAPEDAETAHQFRIAIRQVRSLLSFIRPLLNEEKYELIQDQLRNLANKIGYLRELDVITEEWRLFTGSHINIPVISTAFIEVLEKERAGQMAELLLLFNANAPLAGLHDLWMLLLDPGWESGAESNRTYADYVDDRFNTLLKKAKKELKGIDLKDIRRTHKLRISIKKLRYDAAILKPKVKREIKFADNLKELQDRLGQICDAERAVLILSDLRSKYRELSIDYESGILAGHLITGADKMAGEYKWLR